MKEDNKGPPKILVVDNDKALLSTIKEYLERHDYQVKSVATGVDALRLLRSETYDVLVTDVVMPGISGLGLIGISRQEFPGLPIIVMTGYGKQVKDLAFERSPDCYLEKPFKPTELLSAIESALKKE